MLWLFQIGDNTPLEPTTPVDCGGDWKRDSMEKLAQLLFGCYCHATQHVLCELGFYSSSTSRLVLTKANIAHFKEFKTILL